MWYINTIKKQEQNQIIEFSAAFSSPTSGALGPAKKEEKKLITEPISEV